MLEWAARGNEAGNHRAPNKAGAIGLTSAATTPHDKAPAPVPLSGWGTRDQAAEPRAYETGHPHRRVARRHAGAACARPVERLPVSAIRHRRGSGALVRGLSRPEPL